METLSGKRWTTYCFPKVWDSMKHMVEPTVVSRQASISPSYGPKIAPARTFCKKTITTRCCCWCNNEVWCRSNDGIEWGVIWELFKWGYWLMGAVVCGGANSMMETGKKTCHKLLQRGKIGIPTVWSTFLKEATACPSLVKCNQCKTCSINHVSIRSPEWILTYLPGRRIQEWRRSACRGRRWRRAAARRRCAQPCTAAAARPVPAAPPSPTETSTCTNTRVMQEDKNLTR